MTTRSGLRRAASVAILVVAIILFCFSLLAVFRAPTFNLWKLSIIATEAGHLVAPFGLLFLFGVRGSRAMRSAALFGVAASVLLLTPAARAARVAGGVNVARLYFGGQPTVPHKQHSYRAGDGSPLLLDFYPAQGVVNAPLIVMIHGGSWHGGGPGDLAPLNSRLAREGYSVAAISYRFAPEHPFPAQLEDVRDALAYLTSQAAELKLDTTRVALIGRSAGGHLAALAAMTAQDPDIRGAVSLYGVHDLAWGYAHPAPPRVHNSQLILREFLAGTPQSAPAAYRDAAPLTYAATSPPMLLIHGARDELVNVEHARHLSAALTAAGRRHTYIELPWATHGCDYVFRGPCGQITTRAVEGFLADVLAGPPKD